MKPELILLKLKQQTEIAIKAQVNLGYSLGVYFGYPDCCIQEYCTDILNNRDPGNRRINGKGFIPCTSHYNQIQLGTPIESLIDKRVSSIKY